MCVTINVNIWTSEGGRSFAITTTKPWNDLPIETKRSPGIKSFKKSLITFFSNA